jgi:hypothetical protein
MGHPIPRGSCVCGRYALSKDTGISPQSVRTSLARLKSTNDITIKSTNKFSVIYIVNYQDYQDNSTNSSTIKSTFNQPATNQQLTTSKECKNDKNEKNIYTFNDSEIDNGLESFNKILNAYPVKIGESAARKTFFDWNVTNGMVERILISIKKYRDHLAANSWKTPMNFGKFLLEWTDWEDHEEVKSEDQKVEELRKSLKERL